MSRGFLRFVKLFGLERTYRKAHRPRPSVRLDLECLTERILLSVSPVGQPPASTPMVAVLDRVDQIIVVVQSELSSIVRTITQEFAQAEAYIMLQLDHIFGINFNPQNTSLKSLNLQAANGSGNILTMASNGSVGGGNATINSTARLLVGVVAASFCEVNLYVHFSQKANVR